MSSSKLQFAHHIFCEFAASPTITHSCHYHGFFNIAADVKHFGKLICLIGESDVSEHHFRRLKNT